MHARAALLALAALAAACNPSARGGTELTCPEGQRRCQGSVYGACHGGVFVAQAGGTCAPQIQ